MRISTSQIMGSLDYLFNWMCFKVVFVVLVYMKNYRKKLEALDQGQQVTTHGPRSAAQCLFIWLLPF